MGGGYVAYDYLQDRTIGDLLLRLGTSYRTNEDFKVGYSRLKNDIEFVNNLVNKFKKDAESITRLSAEEGAELLKSWCNEIFALELNEKNIKKQLQLGQKYCNFPEEERIIAQIDNNSLNLLNVKKAIINKGLKKGGHLFLSFADTSKPIGRQQRFSYCWDTTRKDWVSSTGEEDCRGKYAAN